MDWIRQGFLEVILNAALEIQDNKIAGYDKTAATNLTVAFLIFLLQKHKFKGMPQNKSNYAQNILYLILIISQQASLFSEYKITDSLFQHLYFVFVFLFCTFAFEKLFTFCEVYFISNFFFHMQKVYVHDSRTTWKIPASSGLLVAPIAIVAVHLILQKLKVPRASILGVFGMAIVLFIPNFKYQIKFIFNTVLFGKNHIQVMGVWLAVLFIGTPIIYYIKKKNLMRSITIRKLFHFQGIIIFSSGILYAPILMKVAFDVAIFLFLSLEILRRTVKGILPGITQYEQFVKTFIDQRDSDKLIATHIFLLAGFAYPFLVSYDGNEYQYLWYFAGIIFLGVGDSFAAIIGSKFGKNKQFIAPKSWEGTLAGILSMIGFIMGLLLFIDKKFLLRTEGIDYLICVGGATIFIGLLEAFTAQNDNLMIPIIFYNIIRLLSDL